MTNKTQMLEPVGYSACDPDTPEPQGGPVDYYRVRIAHPNQADAPYTAECSDIIEALGMDFNEGNAFKALWRRAAAQALDKQKKDYAGRKYDAQKAAHFIGRVLATQYGVPVQPKEAPTVEPYAYAYKLARAYDSSIDGTFNRYVDWDEEPVLSLTKPHVPEGAIKELTPLYKGELNGNNT